MVDTRAITYHADHAPAIDAAAPAIAATAAAAPSSSIPPFGIRGTPPTFDGASKSAAAVSQFLFQLGCFFKLNSIIAGADRIAYVGLSLSDAASQWLMLYERQIGADYELFVTLFSKEFAPANPTRAARAELWSCTQTGSLADYNARFRALANQISDLSPAELADRYTHGLKSAIRNKIIESGDTTFDAITERAARIDQAHALSAAYPTASAAAGSSNHRPQSYRAAAIATPSAPSIFLDPSVPRRIGLDRKGPITPEVKAELTRLRGCFYCRWTGHQSYNCPEKQRLDQGNGPSQ
jgi:hypothetical protein